MYIQEFKKSRLQLFIIFISNNNPSYLSSIPITYPMTLQRWITLSRSSLSASCIPILWPLLKGNKMKPSWVKAMSLCVMPNNPCSLSFKLTLLWIFLTSARDCHILQNAEKLKHQSTASNIICVNFIHTILYNLKPHRHRYCSGFRHQYPTVNSCHLSFFHIISGMSE